MHLYYFKSNSIQSAQFKIYYIHTQQFVFRLCAFTFPLSSNTYISVIKSIKLNMFLLG